jgi:hypothetical protein
MDSINPVKRARPSSEKESNKCPLQTQVITNMVLGYMPEKRYLYFAAVDTVFKEAWRLSGREKKTGKAFEGMTSRQLSESFDSGVLAPSLRGRGRGLLEGMIRIGRVDLLFQVKARVGVATLPSSLMHESARVGNLFLTEQIYSANSVPDFYDKELESVVQDSFHVGIRSGNLDLVEWFLGVRGCRSGYTEFESACSTGDVRIVERILESMEATGEARDEIIGEGMDEAIREGHFEVVRYMASTGHDVSLGLPTVMAVRSGDLKMLELVVSEGARCWSETVDEAGSVGNVDFLEYMKSNPGIFLGGEDVLTVGGSAVYRAVEKEHVEVLDWYHENDFQFFTEELCEVAAREGKMKSLVWLREHGVPLGNTLGICKERGRIRMWTWAKMSVEKVGVF